MSTAMHTPKLTRSDIVWQAIERFDERRHYPRVALDLPVPVRTGQGKQCSVKLVNISPDGGRIRSNLATAQVLHPRGGQVTLKTSSIVQMQAMLPLEGPSKVSSICARLLCLMTVTEDPRCIIGLQFLDPRPEPDIAPVFCRTNAGVLSQQPGPLSRRQYVNGV